VDGLDLSGFHIDKKRVKVTLGNVRETGELVTVRASNITATIKGLRWSYRQQYFPYANGVGVADADIKGGDITLGFRLVRHRPKEGGEEKKAGEGGEEGNDGGGAAGGGGGGADGGAAGGAGGAGEELIPIPGMPIALSLCTKTIEIESMTMRTKGSWLSWVYNLLAAVLKNVVRNYIKSTLLESLEDQVDTLMDLINRKAAGVEKMEIAQTLLGFTGLKTEQLDIIDPPQPSKARQSRLAKARQKAAEEGDSLGEEYVSTFQFTSTSQFMSTSQSIFAGNEVTFYIQI
jgi:hypothetical protein